MEIFTMGSLKENCECCTRSLFSAPRLSYIKGDQKTLSSFLVRRKLRVRYGPNT
jgi:hypothetical protein